MNLDPTVGEGVFRCGGPPLLIYGASRRQAKTRPYGRKQFASRARAFARNDDGVDRSRGKTPAPIAVGLNVRGWRSTLCRGCAATGRPEASRWGRAPIFSVAGSISRIFVVYVIAKGHVQKMPGHAVIIIGESKNICTDSRSDGCWA